MEINIETKRMIVTVGLIVSLPFFMINILVYSFLKDLRRTVHGKIFISHQSSMIVGYLLLAALNLRINISDVPCIVLGFIMQLAFLATFTWMNVMCFDIWWNFRTKKTSGHMSEFKKFLLYSVYAWGLPLIILSGTLIIEFTPIVSKYHFLKPKIGTVSCFFTGLEAAWLYLYGPMGVLILINVLMFVSFAKKIFLNSTTSQHSLTYKERFNVSLKLFIIMGVNWVAELLSWAFEYNNLLFCIADVINSLQGVIIFIIFVCKIQVLRMMKSALCPGSALIEDTMNSSCNYYSNKTDGLNGTTGTHNETVQMKVSNKADEEDC